MLKINIKFLFMKYIYSPIVNSVLNFHKKNLKKEIDLKKKLKFLPDYKYHFGLQKSEIEWHKNLNEIKKNLVLILDAQYLRLYFRKLINNKDIL